MVKQTVVQLLQMTWFKFNVDLLNKDHLSIDRSPGIAFLGCSKFNSPNCAQNGDNVVVDSKDDGVATQVIPIDFNILFSFNKEQGTLQHLVFHGDHSSLLPLLLLLLLLVVVVLLVLLLVLLLLLLLLFFCCARSTLNMAAIVAVDLPCFRNFVARFAIA